jgi:manganese oxidase
MYHCHVQSHSDLGMEGLFVVTNADGSISEETRRRIERWKERAHGSH